ncbi:DUF3025 domain-containing protein [Comamonas badia]|uniref:DUF3025 domain-containing protein n=1 Tax=Comamonas badia TaxID=265291 RepID=UPI00040A7D8A|nr:DUF3025 domain-containing protein [Comamonas badia]
MAFRNILDAPAWVQGIAWEAPWLADYAPLGRRIAQAIAEGRRVEEALMAQAPALLPVRFVAQARLPAGTAYEAFIAARHEVPTRSNPHDFFNGLVWLHWPLAKARLNALQAQAIARDGVGATRGPLRDAATVFDENGALLLAPEPLWQVLRARDWQRLFVALRPLWREARLWLFGHALMEKLISPRKQLVAHVYQAHSAIKKEESLDTWLARDLTADHLAGKPFAPLPVLGVPGWCGENANFRFYDDSTVFRPPRSP